MQQRVAVSRTTSSASAFPCYSSRLSRPDSGRNVLRVGQYTLEKLPHRQKGGCEWLQPLGGRSQGPCKRLGRIRDQRPWLRLLSPASSSQPPYRDRNYSPK